jgi:predicted GNAT superfamily acetyltransferase
VALASLGGGVGEVAEDELRAGAVLALGIAEDGSPVPGRLDGATSLVAVPRDIAALRATEPGLARRWRLAVREALTDLTGRGGRIDGFDRTGWYIVRRES